MSKLDNLKSFNKLSRDEAVKIQRAGGKAVVKLKKEKKAYRETLQDMLDIMKKQTLEELKDKSKRELLSCTDVLSYEVAQLIKTQDPNIKLKAIENLQDRLHGKPKQEIDTKNDTNMTIGWEK